MERAGFGAFNEIILFAKTLDPIHVKHFVILAGKGNNGGDGYVIARYLSEKTEYRVSVISICPVNDLTGDALLNANRLSNRVDFTVADHISEKLLADEGIIYIDCLLGTGVYGSMRKPFKTMVDQMNGSGNPIIAIDVPSGVNADDGSISNAAVCADMTITMGLPKKGIFLGAGADLSGRIRVIDIGIPKQFVDEEVCEFEAIGEVEARRFLSRLPKSVHKGTMGRILVIAGSASFPGAAILTGLGALRSGGGLVTVAYPKSISGILKPKENALILKPFNDDGLGYHIIENEKNFEEILNSFDIIAVGPGLGTEERTGDMVAKILQSDMPVVVDADALNALSRDWNVFPRKAPTVLTPHPGELNRLLKRFGFQELIDQTRIEQATAVAKFVQGYVVLKGPATVVAGYSGEIFVNMSGSPALATGGTGDVLTGIITALICQGGVGKGIIEAIICAVFLHGRAAEITANGMRHFIADDLLLALGPAMKSLSPFA